MYLKFDVKNFSVEYNTHLSGFIDKLKTGNSRDGEPPLL